MASSIPSEPRYLSLAQASVVVNLSVRTLRRAIKNGRLRAHHLGPLVRIELGELQRWVESDGEPPSPILDDAPESASNSDQAAAAVAPTRRDRGRAGR